MTSFSFACALLAIIFSIIDATVPGAQQFIYHGFKPNDLILSGTASIAQDGILSLTNNGGSNTTGHGFYTRSLPMDGTDYGMPLASFSTTFVFSITPYLSGSSGDEMAFVISSTMNFSGNIVPEAPPNFFAIMLGFHDDKPVCIVVANLLVDDWNRPLMPDDKALLLSSGNPVQLWAEYNGTSMGLNVTVALIQKHEPILPPLLSHMFDMSSMLLVVSGNSLAAAYAGFSASTGDNDGATAHKVLGWSFSLGGGPAQPLNYSLLQQLQATNKTQIKNLVKWLPATLRTHHTGTCNGFYAIFSMMIEFDE